MEQPKDEAGSEGKDPSLPTPGTESSAPGTLPTLPPWLLSTSNPAHLGLPEHLASVTVPIRLDTLSYLLHSALMGAYSLHQALPSCPCSSLTGLDQQALASCTPPPQGQGRGRARGRGAWATPRRHAPSQAQPSWGAEMAEQPKRSRPWNTGAHPKIPRMAGQAQDEKKPRDPELGPAPTIPLPTAEDWESEY
ncbi:piRNA-mediated silencing protein C19orf84 homolog [Thomomys bottae]